ncbi:unnamed protein product [Spirodela intermedia]|uniref:Uncharacterized protein n=1 Tax=Spirodela intermedia TaxID=51605 RepID=A0A7I8K2Q6_SPIIN|nr:unnamed protein product [Spirodela intermedia]
MSIMSCEAMDNNQHPFVDSKVEDSEFVDLKANFFPKIRTLWIQAHILFIFCITARSALHPPRVLAL